MAITRLLCLVAAVSLALAGCGLREGDAPGTAEGAAGAAEDFLSLLAGRKAEEAWGHLTPATQVASYGGDQAGFANDVRRADWAQMAWDVGPVTDYETSWGVNVVIDEGAVPGFLFQRGVVSKADPYGMLLLVQLNDGGYAIAGRGLDAE